jgi:hypothetical protein
MPHSTIEPEPKLLRLLEPRESLVITEVALENAQRHRQLSLSR